MTNSNGVHFADLDDVRDYAASIPTTWTECREVIHNLRPYDVKPTENGGYERIRRCSRCRTKRVDILDSHFTILHTKYEYPEGYQMERGHGRISSEGRNVFRGINTLREAGRKS